MSTQNLEHALQSAGWQRDVSMPDSLQTTLYRTLKAAYNDKSVALGTITASYTLLKDYEVHYEDDLTNVVNDLTTIKAIGHWCAALHYLGYTARLGHSMRKAAYRIFREVPAVGHLPGISLLTDIRDMQRCVVAHAIIYGYTDKLDYDWARLMTHPGDSQIPKMLIYGTTSGFYGYFVLQEVLKTINDSRVEMVKRILNDEVQI